MKLLSGFARLIKLLIGWVMLILFGVTAVYGIFDEVRDEPGVITICFLMALAGLWLILSAGRDRKKAEAIRTEETRYRRQQEETAQERYVQQQRDEIRYVAVECPGCGAIGKVRLGGVGRCPYCDTPLQGK